MGEGRRRREVPVSVVYGHISMDGMGWDGAGVPAIPLIALLFGIDSPTPYPLAENIQNPLELSTSTYSSAPLYLFSSTKPKS
jgi:hypothetical protein